MDFLIQLREGDVGRLADAAKTLGRYALTLGRYVLTLGRYALIGIVLLSIGPSLNSAFLRVVYGDSGVGDRAKGQSASAPALQPPAVEQSQARNAPPAQCESSSAQPPTQPLSTAWSTPPSSKPQSDQRLGMGRGIQRPAPPFHKQPHQEVPPLADGQPPAPEQGISNKGAQRREHTVEHLNGLPTSSASPLPQSRFHGASPTRIEGLDGISVR